MNENKSTLANPFLHTEQKWLTLVSSTSTILSSTATLIIKKILLHVQEVLSNLYCILNMQKQTRLYGQKGEKSGPFITGSIFEMEKILM